MKKLLLPIFAVIFLSGGYASAAPLAEKNISLTDADSLAIAAIEECKAGGHNVSVTVVDRGGNIKVMKRMDNAGPNTLEGSHSKAYTALSSKNSTSTVMTNAQNNPAAANMKDIPPGFLLLGGGVPVKSGQEVIGAIGVAGAPSSNLDESCALKAIEKVNIK